MKDNNKKSKNSNNNKTVTGHVKFFNIQRGYGFITTETGEDVYVHVSNINTPRVYNGLNVGDEVTMTIIPSKKGIQAVDVVALEALKQLDDEEGCDDCSPNTVDDDETCDPAPVE